MKLSVYLMRDSVRKFGDILLPKASQGIAPFKPLKASTTMPFPCEAYIQVNKSGPPKWEGFLKGAFKTAGLGMENQSSSFVLLIEKQGRFFAVTLGFGFTAIDPAKIETRFGLMVAANWLTKVNGVETNVIDRVSSNKKLYLGESSEFAEFALNPQIDFIRRMEGKLPKNNTASKISGCDSCCIAVNGDITGLGAVCTELMGYYEADDYKKRYPFLDQLKPLSKHDPRIDALEKKLRKRLATKSLEKISIAFPEMPDEEKLHHYKVSSGVSVEMDELTLEGIYEFMGDYNVDPDADKIHVIGIGDNDSPVTRRRSLRDYLAAEFDKAGETFIFCNGEWFLAETNYVKQVRAAVAALDDVTDKLNLLPVRNDETEGEYNRRVAKMQDMVMMDKDNFKIGGAHDKIEVCDLLTEPRQMICVKKMVSSATMSHLFSQGSVSATLLRKEPKYRDRFNKHGKKKWSSFVEVTDHNVSKVQVVYAIATRKIEPLAEGMFFFSLVNLLNHAATVRMTGCKVALCKIDYEDVPGSPIRSKRKRQRKSAMKVGA